MNPAWIMSFLCQHCHKYNFKYFLWRKKFMTAKMSRIHENHSEALDSLFRASVIKGKSMHPPPQIFFQKLFLSLFLWCVCIEHFPFLTFVCSSLLITGLEST